jgi:hypothetical protein
LGMVAVVSDGIPGLTLARSRAAEIVKTIRQPQPEVPKRTIVPAWRPF